MSSSDAELILDYFQGRQGVIAVADDGKTFRPVETNLKPEWLAMKHLAQVTCIGFYLMCPGNTVLCSCVDFDNKPDKPDPEWKSKAEQLYFALTYQGLKPAVEVSASGEAAHVWLFFAEPVDASLIRRFWNRVAENAGVPLVEIYPRQDQLSGKGLGNLVRYPLWNKSHFVDVESEWEHEDVTAALGWAQKVTESDLQDIADGMHWGRLGKEQDSDVMGETQRDGLPPRVQKLINKSYSLLSRRWAGEMSGLRDESRSALVQSIACELVRLYVPTNEIEQAVRLWCKNRGYEKGERPEWVKRTVERAYDFAVEKKESRSVDCVTLEDAEIEFVEMLTSEAPIVIRSGLWELDNSIDGLSPGNMAVIAARPGHGKSAFALQWLDRAAANGCPGLIISEEMSRLELAQRGLLAISKLDEADWRNKPEQLKSEIKQHHKNRASTLIVENCNSIDRVEEIVEQRKASHGIGIVAVDYLQLLTSRGASRYDVVTDISRRLKQMAKRNEVAVIALCQLNREIEKREKHEPKLSDLRESGQIEQDADLVMFLQWPLKMSAKANAEHYCITVSKRRNGPIRQPKLLIKFDAARQCFGSSRPDMVQYSDRLFPQQPAAPECEGT